MDPVSVAPVLGALGPQPVPKLPAATLLADLHRLGWRTELVLQMPREKAQPLLAEIPLALRQLHDIAPPGESPLLLHAGAARGDNCKMPYMTRPCRCQLGFAGRST